MKRRPTYSFAKASVYSLATTLPIYDELPLEEMYTKRHNLIKDEMEFPRPPLEREPN